MKEEDKKDAWTDEYGVQYSKDGKKLLKCTDRGLKNYTIRQGTRSICDHAFGGCISLHWGLHILAVRHHPRLRDQHWQQCVFKLRLLAVRHHPQLRDQHWRPCVCGLRFLAVRHHPRLRDKHWRVCVCGLLILAFRHHPRLRDEHWRWCVCGLYYR